MKSEARIRMNPRIVAEGNFDKNSESSYDN
jgi:hypothetical protein